IHTWNLFQRSPKTSPQTRLLRKLGGRPLTPRITRTSLLPSEVKKKLTTVFLRPRNGGLTTLALIRLSTSQCSWTSEDVPTLALWTSIRPERISNKVSLNSPSVNHSLHRRPLSGLPYTALIASVVRRSSTSNHSQNASNG